MLTIVYTYIFTYTLLTYIHTSLLYPHVPGLHLLERHQISLHTTYLDQENSPPPGAAPLTLRTGTEDTRDVSLYSFTSGTSILRQGGF